jgi:MoaA/NifB/PqqE/SkfB family radical SAM enzyme
MKINKSLSNQSENLHQDVVIAVTYQCNGRCQFCNIWQNKKTFSCQSVDYKNLPQNLKNVNISGGEPFLRNDLPEIIRTIAYRCPQAKIIISTNGFLPSTIKKQIQEIIKFKRDIGVAVSLDGFGQAHEELRGFPGGYSLVLETIRLLKELGIKNLKIAFTLGDQNIDQLRKVYQLSKESKVEFSLAVYHNSPHYFQKKDNRIVSLSKIRKELNWLIKEELQSFSLKKWLRAYFAWGILIFLKNKERVLPDYSGLTSLFIDPFGYIYPSDVWDLKIGQLQKVKDWPRFSNQVRQKILSEKPPVSWMICTARQAMKEHWIRVGWWILQTKARQMLSQLRENPQRGFSLPRNVRFPRQPLYKKGSLGTMPARISRPLKKHLPSFLQK